MSIAATSSPPPIKVHLTIGVTTHLLDASALIGAAVAAGPRHQSNGAVEATNSQQVQRASPGAECTAAATGSPLRAGTHPTRRYTPMRGVSAWQRPAHDRGSYS